MARVCRNTEHRWMDYASLHIMDAQQGNLEVQPMKEPESAPLTPPRTLEPLPPSSMTGPIVFPCPPTSPHPFPTPPSLPPILSQRNW